MASWTQRALDLVERAGNRLPHPFWLFCGLFLVVTGLSAGLAGTDIEQPETQLLVETVDGQRLLGVPTTLPAELDLKAGYLIHPVRMALTAAKAGPSLFDLVAVARAFRRARGVAPRRSARRSPVSIG